jgi:hypothetical protein
MHCGCPGATGLRDSPRHPGPGPVRLGVRGTTEALLASQRRTFRRFEKPITSIPVCCARGERPGSGGTEQRHEVAAV